MKVLYKIVKTTKSKTSDDYIWMSHYIENEIYSSIEEAQKVADLENQTAKIKNKYEDRPSFYQPIEFKLEAF